MALRGLDAEHDDAERGRALAARRRLEPVVGPERSAVQGQRAGGTGGTGGVDNAEKMRARTVARRGLALEREGVGPLLGLALRLDVGPGPGLRDPNPADRGLRAPEVIGEAHGIDGGCTSSSATPMSPSKPTLPATRPCSYVRRSSTSFATTMRRS